MRGSSQAHLSQEATEVRKGTRVPGLVLESLLGGGLFHVLHAGWRL